MKVDLDLYIEVFGEMILYFSTSNHSNYARWLPFYVRYLMKLKTQHPDLHAEFTKEHFVVQRSHARYSLMAKDESHEHSKKEIKPDGGYTNFNVNDPITLLMQPP